MRLPARHVIGVALLALVLASLSPRTAAQSNPLWTDVEGAEGAKLRAAVFRPQGAGPFPLVLWLHGSDGLNDNALAWASDIATAGYVVMAGCYLGKGAARVGGADPCPDAHPINDEKQYAVRNVVALLGAGRNLSGVRGDRVGLVGVSWGGAVAALTASGSANVQAVVTFAGTLRYRVSRNEGAPLDALAKLSAPILIVHGTSDTAVLVEVSREYEQVARALKKDVQAHYVAEAPHTFIIDPRFRADVYRLTIEFLNKHLRN